MLCTQYLFRMENEIMGAHLRRVAMLYPLWGCIDVGVAALAAPSLPL